MKASSYFINDMEVDNSIPIPPAPTSPSTTADRIAFSTENKLVATNNGNPIGRIEATYTPKRLLPVDLIASTGPLSISSILSEKKRAQNAIVSTIMVKIPAKDPNPTEITNKSAHTKSGIVRITDTIKRSTPLTTACGVVFLEINRAIGRLITTPSTVPTSAISNVSNIAKKILCQRLISGGNAREINTPILPIPSHVLLNEISAFITPEIKNPANPTMTIQLHTGGMEKRGGVLFALCDIL